MVVGVDVDVVAKSVVLATARVAIIIVVVMTVVVLIIIVVVIAGVPSSCLSPPLSFSPDAML